MTHGADLFGNKHRILSRGTVGATPDHLKMLVDAACDNTQVELESRLKKAGIDLSKWGVDGAKRLSDLFEEVRSGKCACVLDRGQSGHMTRIACILRIKVHAACNGEVKVLHATETQTWFRHAGQVLRLPARLMKHGQLDNALEGLWFEKFGLSAAYVNENFTRFGMEIFAEEKTSASYPGLRCVYIVHEVAYWAREPVAECEALGLPDGNIVERSAPRWPDGHMETACYVWITEEKDEAAQTASMDTTVYAEDNNSPNRRDSRVRSAPTVNEETMISIQRDVRFSHHASLPV